MKRVDLVQMSVVIAGICSIFFCLTLLPAFFYYLLSWFSDGLAGGSMMRYFIQTILLLTAYLLFALIAIRNSKPIAEWLGAKAHWQGDINFSMNAKGLLFALFIGFAVYGLVGSLPQLIADCYNFFKENKTSPFEIVNKTSREQLFTQAAKTGLFIIILVYADVFSQFFAARLKNTDDPEDIGKQTV